MRFYTKVLEFDNEIGYVRLAKSTGISESMSFNFGLWVLIWCQFSNTGRIEYAVTYLDTWRLRLTGLPPSLS